MMIPTLTWTTTDRRLHLEVQNSGEISFAYDVRWLPPGGSCIMFDDIYDSYSLADDHMAPAEPTEKDVDSPTEGKVNEPISSMRRR